MGNRGPKPKGKVKIEWSSDFAYAIGLLATDGNISSNGRHVTFSSKDKEQIQNFMSALQLFGTIGKNISGSGAATLRFQFSDSLFVSFLKGIGIGPAKSHVLEEVRVPIDFFFDFLRGCFDGDGSFYSYNDRRWRSSKMFYLSFCSASAGHLLWLQRELHLRLGVSGALAISAVRTTKQLRYAKRESLSIIEAMYKNSHRSLSRKRLKIEKALGILAKLEFPN